MNDSQQIEQPGRMTEREIKFFLSWLTEQECQELREHIAAVRRWHEEREAKGQIKDKIEALK